MPLCPCRDAITAPADLPRPAGPSYWAALTGACARRKLCTWRNASATCSLVSFHLTGVNPELGDRVPLRLLREGDLNVIGPEVMAAARAFIAGG